MNVKSIISENLQFFRDQWALTALVLFIVILIVRGLFLKSMFKTLKDWGKRIHREILHEYGNRSYLGWVCYLAAILPLEVMICFPKYWPESMTRKEGILLFICFLLMGNLLHARALHLASIAVAKDRIEGS